MSSDKRPFARETASVARPYVLRAALYTLLGLLAVDAVVLLCFDGAAWQWTVLAGVEALFLAFILWRADRAMRQMLTPLGELTAAAESLKDYSLDVNEMRRLAQKLEQVQTPAAGRLAVVGGGRELSALTDAINAMLARIDESYQAQVRFTSDASHELRTPIAVIQGYANLLDRWGKDDPKIRQEAIDAIRQEANAMAGLLEELLFLVRGDKDTQKVVMEQVDLTGLVTAVARETDMVDETHQISAEVDAGVTCVADKALIKECLRVLCDNAMKYTPEGGSITIGLRTQGEEHHISVTDTGVGIAPEELPYIFQRFYRADSSRARATGGSGLGLSIAAWIAARHGGRIDVTSTPGEGSCFTLVLPAQPV